MEKKGIITKITFTKQWGDGPNVVFFHDIELDNGDKGSIGSKEKNPAKLGIGQELTYTIEPGQYGNKIKGVNAAPAFSGGGKKGPDPKTQMIAFAMSYAKDLIVADKAGLDQLPALFNKIHKLMIEKI